MATYTSSARTVGDTRRLYLDVATSSGGPINSDITLLIETPLGAVARYTSTSTGSTGVLHEATGVYYRIVESTAPGDYRYFWRSTGAVDMSTDGRWAVRPEAVST